MLVGCLLKDKFSEALFKKIKSRLIWIDGFVIHEKTTQRKGELFIRNAWRHSLLFVQ